jgi:cell division protein ZapA
MKTETHCTIQLLNKSYNIKCLDENVNDLQAAAEKLQDQLLKEAAKFKQLTQDQLLLLAALHLSHELVTEQQEREQQRQQLASLITKLSAVAPLLTPAESD